MSPTLGRLSAVLVDCEYKITGDTRREAPVSAHPPPKHSHIFNIFVNLYGFDIVNMLIKKLGFFSLLVLLE